MERQLANLTGLVQKALTQNPQVAQNYLATAPGQQYRTGKCILYVCVICFIIFNSFLVNCKSKYNLSSQILYLPKQNKKSSILK